MNGFDEVPFEYLLAIVSWDDLLDEA